jgi:hypothetical protein
MAHILEQKSTKQRIAFALKCKPEEVPDNPSQIKQALDNRRAVLAAEKLRKVKDGESIH